MSIGGRVVLAVTFQEVDAAPHAQAAAQGNHQSLQHVDSVSEKIHKSYFLSFCRIVIEGPLRSIRTSRKAHPALRWPVCVSCTVAVSLPGVLPVTDTDLAALLGNALDNAIEGVQNAATKKIILRCRLDKGLLMLRVENPAGSAVRPDLSTTKRETASHGFGLPGMREIARRYHGTLDANVEDGQFSLIVCLMAPSAVAESDRQHQRSFMQKNGTNA